MTFAPAWEPALASLKPCCACLQVVEVAAAEESEAAHAQAAEDALASGDLEKVCMLAPSRMSTLAGVKCPHDWLVLTAGGGGARPSGGGAGGGGGGRTGKFCSLRSEGSLCLHAALTFPFDDSQDLADAVLAEQEIAEMSLRERLDPTLVRTSAAASSSTPGCIACTMGTMADVMAVRLSCAGG